MKRKAPGRVTPRDWLRDGPFPWPAPGTLRPGERLRGCYVVSGVEPVHAAAGAAVVRLMLAEARGSLEAWAPVSRAPDGADWFHAGAYIGIQGTVHPAGASVAVEVDELAPIHVGLEDLALFLPSSARRPADMERDLGELIDSVEDGALAELLTRLLGPEAEAGPGFRLAPAATRHHHAWLGGLLEHTLSVAHLCDAIAAQYGSAIDRDLLITGALLHDIGKVREIGARAGFPYTEEGRLLGHILLGLRMVADAARAVPDLPAGRLLLLEHLIAAHQGRYEWQSPREPGTAEALILHHADDLDAKLNRTLRPRETGPASAKGAPADVSARAGAARDRATIRRAPADADPSAETARRDDDTLDMFA